MDIIHGKQGHIYIIGYIYRLGCLSFITELEHKHYPPGTQLNDLFNVYMVKYSDMLYNVIEIPCNKTIIEKCHGIAIVNGLKMVSGKPWNGKMEFPVNCKAEACFTLETTDHKLYVNLDMRSLILEEAENIKKKYCDDDDD